MDKEKVIELYLSREKILVWNPRDVRLLREIHHIVGSLAGALPRAPRQNIQLGLPLELMPEEAFALVTYGVGKIVRLHLPNRSQEDILTFQEERRLSFEKQNVLHLEDTKVKEKELWNCDLISRKKRKQAQRQKRLQKMEEDQSSAKVEKMESQACVTGGNVLHDKEANISKPVSGESRAEEMVETMEVPLKGDEDRSVSPIPNTRDPSSRFVSVNNITGGMNSVCKDESGKSQKRSSKSEILIESERTSGLNSPFIKSNPQSPELLIDCKLEGKSGDCIEKQSKKGINRMEDEIADVVRADRSHEDWDIRGAKNASAKFGEPSVGKLQARGLSDPSQLEPHKDFPEVSTGRECDTKLSKVPCTASLSAHRPQKHQEDTFSVHSKQERELSDPLEQTSQPSTDLVKLSSRSDHNTNYSCKSLKSDCVSSANLSKPSSERSKQGSGHSSQLRNNTQPNKQLSTSSKKQNNNKKHSGKSLNKSERGCERFVSLPNLSSEHPMQGKKRPRSCKNLKPSSSEELNEQEKSADDGCRVQLFTEAVDPDVTDVTDWSFPSTDRERLRAAVFLHFWEQGYFLTSGMKFGGDFLVYKGDPLMFHSTFIAVCIPYDEMMSSQTIISYGRLGPIVKKTVVLCSFDAEGMVKCVSLQWSGL